MLDRLKITALSHPSREMRCVVGKSLHQIMGQEEQELLASPRRKRMAAVAFQVGNLRKESRAVVCAHCYPDYILWVMMAFKRSALLVLDLPQQCILSREGSGNFIRWLNALPGQFEYTWYASWHCSCTRGTQLCKHVSRSVCMLCIGTWSVGCHLFPPSCVQSEE